MTKYYVKNGGNNNRDGLSDANAWETISKVNSINFSNNDVICFKRGSIFTDATLTLNSTSVGRNGITVQDYGTGNKPWFNGNKVKPIIINQALVNLIIKNIDVSGSDFDGGPDSARVTIQKVSGLKIDGLEYDGWRDSSKYYRSNAIAMGYVLGDIEVVNCTIKNVMKDTWKNSTTAWGPLDAHAMIFWQRPGDKKTEGIVKVHDNNLTNIYADGIQTAGVCTPTYIYNNNIINFGENAVDCKRGQYIKIYHNNVSSGNVIANAASTAFAGPETIGDIEIYENYIYNTKDIGIAISILENNYSVHHNYFYNVGLGIVMSNGDNINIYSNVFNLTEPVESSFGGTKLSGIRVMYYNMKDLNISGNTFYISSSNHLYGIAVQSLNLSSGNIKNNIIHMNRNSPDVFPLYVEDYDNSGNLPTISNNLLYGTNTNRVKIESSPGIWNTYNSNQQSAWRSAGHPGELFINPRFVDIQKGDFRLTSNSPCIDNGTNLGSPYNLGLDPINTNFNIHPPKVHTLNRNNYGWDLGAYVYAENGTIPNPCLNVTCDDICVDYDLYSQKCVDGDCVTDQLLEQNSTDCNGTPPVVPPVTPPVVPPVTPPPTIVVTPAAVITREEAKAGMLQGKEYYIKCTIPILDMIPGITYNEIIPILPGFRIQDRP